jgi:CheY-like chemotaxis protein
MPLRLRSPFRLRTAIVVARDPDFRAIVSFMLREMGFRCVSAVSDGESAWTGLNLTKFDLVLCDLNVEPVNGFELLRRVRASRDMSDAPFVLVSTNLTQSDWREAIRAGVTEFLFKPFNRAELRVAVEFALLAPATLGTNVVRLFPRTNFMQRQ